MISIYACPLLLEDGETGKPKYTLESSKVKKDFLHKVLATTNEHVVFITVTIQSDLDARYGRPAKYKVLKDMLKDWDLEKYVILDETNLYNPNYPSDHKRLALTILKGNKS